MTKTSPFKIFLFSFSLLTFCSANCQDMIKKNNGESIKVKISDTNLNEVFYKPADNLNGPNQSIAKSDIAEISFENGRKEYFNAQPAEKLTTIEETKQFITDEINAHGFDPDSFKRKYKASFEGDYLRLTVLKKSGEESHDSNLYDFANVYRLSGVDRRSDELAFINLFVSALKYEKSNSWDKMKITIRVDSDTRAESIFNALKYYHSLLVSKEKGNSKF